MSGKAIPGAIFAGTGIDISPEGVISLAGGSGGAFTIAGDGLEGVGNTINLGELATGTRTMRVAADATAVLLQQQDETVGDGAVFLISAQTTTDINANGGDLYLRSGDGGLNAGNVVIQTYNSESSITLEEDGTLSLLSTTGNGIHLEDQGGFGIRLDTQGPVVVGDTGSSATHAINGLSDPAAGAVVDYLVVSFNGNPRKIAMLALA